MIVCINLFVSRRKFLKFFQSNWKKKKKKETPQVKFLKLLYDFEGLETTTAVVVPCGGPKMSPDTSI